jgi:PAS domain S-box-containing protein
VALLPLEGAERLKANGRGYTPRADVGAAFRKTSGRENDVTSPVERDKALAFLARLASEFTAVLGLSGLVDRVLESLREEVGFNSCTIGLLDERDRDALRIVGANGIRADFRGLIIPRGHGLNWAVIESGAPLYVPDMQADPRVFRRLEPVRSGIYAPLIVEGRPIGVLSAHRSEAHAFTADDLDLLTVAARYLAGAFEVARLHEQLEHRAAQLREAEAQYRALVEQSLVGVYLITGERFAYVNVAFATIFGYRVDEMIGRLGPSDLIHPDDRAQVARNIQKQLEGAGEASRYTFQGVRKDGTAINCEVFDRRCVHRGQPALMGTLLDITERRRAEDRVQRHLQRLAALRAIDMAITASLDLRVTLHILLDQVTTHLQVDAADVLLLNPHSRMLEYAAGRGFRSDTVTHTRVRLGDGYAGRAAVERRLISIPNLSLSSDDPIRTPLLAGEEFIGYYAAPLIAKGQAKGVLEIFHRGALAPDGEWLEFLDALAGQTAVAIDNAVLFDDLQRTHMDLALAYDTTLEGWSRALDLRDKETEGHTQRVTEMTLRLGRAMSVPEADLVHIRRGALLHDIGKMAIPDSILLKHGPLLTEEEKETMRRHPVYAYQLLSPIAYLRPALDIPYCHHEKWDGTGYPRGLRDEQIPLAARIFAVADVWDALRSDRPYRPAWTEERTRQYIRDQAGRHFDPRVVDVFLQMEGHSGSR